MDKKFADEGQTWVDRVAVIGCLGVLVALIVALAIWPGLAQH